VNTEARDTSVLLPRPAGERSRETAEDALRQCLTPSFPGIVAIRRHPSPAATSYASEVLTLEVTGGWTHRVFLKDFGHSQLPKDDHARRRERELGVYRDLLEHAALGTPAFHGAIWDEAGNRYWLLLEFVEGRQLRWCQFDDWVRAAGWLGRLQGYFACHAERLRNRDFLVPHDEGFFWTRARLAREAGAQLRPPLGGRIARILDGYERLVALMTRQPRTLVHGSYRPQNILVSAPSEPPRVTAVDWELAGLGAPLYDFAFLSDGFRAPQRDTLWDAYRRGAAEWDLLLPPWGEAHRVVDSFRLVKVLKSLGDSVTLGFARATVVKLVDSAEAIIMGLGP
jgi:aminoglycoside phosphotransferase (APT) family kinase protein